MTYRRSHHRLSLDLSVSADRNNAHSGTVVPTHRKPHGNREDFRVNHNRGEKRCVCSGGASVRRNADNDNLNEAQQVPRGTVCIHYYLWRATEDKRQSKAVRIVYSPLN